MRLKSLLVLLCLLGASLLPMAAQPPMLMAHNNMARTGVNSEETTLTTRNVNSATFGKIFQATLDGKVDAQPLYVPGIPVPNRGTHNLLIVATENDSLYALDADTGALLWQAVLLGNGETPSDDRNCPSNVAPTIGITSTPAIAFTPGSLEGSIFAVAMSKGATGKYYQRLYKLNLTAGLQLGTVEIAAKYPATGPQSVGGYDTFDPKQYKERSALLLLNDVVYLAWASHCDDPPYTGWVMGYNATTLKQTSVINITPNGEDGAIWGSGAGLAADSSGNIYFGAANGTFDATLNAQGFPIDGDYGNAFMKLSTAGSRLAVADYFTMYNTNRESDADRDLGSGGVIVLPDMTDANGQVRHLVIGAGKDNNIYLADRDNMGKFNPDNDDAIYQELYGVLTNGVLSMPAYYGGRVYFGSRESPIRAFEFNQAVLSPTPVSQTSTVFPTPGAASSISANGSTNAILWAVENSTPAVLHAYSATNLAQELYNSNQAANGRDQFGAGNKFMVPTIVNGKVYVGTPNGVAAFGLLK
jgi:outer membrane protein assembly factor BamB